MPKRTNQPSKIKRSKRHGFLVKSKTKSGKRIIKRRQQKKRHRIS